MDSRIVEELATRLPKTELAQIIKGMLECGKRNIVVGEADLIRAITFGANAVFGKVAQSSERQSSERQSSERQSSERQSQEPRSQEQRVSTITQTRRRDTGEAVAPAGTPAVAPELAPLESPARRAGGG